MKGLSTDLRERVVEHYRERDEATYESTATHFGVGEATVNRWLRQLRETGSVEERPGSGGRKSPIRLEWLSTHVEAEPDATLKQRALAHQVAFGGKLPSEPAMCLAMKRAGITHKKRLPSRRSGRLSG